MSLSYERKDSAKHLESQELAATTNVTYKESNRRKCYWRLLTSIHWECLKGHLYPECSVRCADYLSVAQADRMIKERRSAQWNTG